jgi:hypothetical protein
MFDVTFPDGVRRGMGFDGHAKYPVVATRNGSTISERDWSRLSAKAKAKLAADDLPESVRAPHTPTASDAEHRVEMLRHYLRGRGLDEESVEEACEIARRETEGGEVEDELPTSGPGGARNAANSQTREPDEKVFRSPGRFGSRPPLGTKSSSEERSMIGEADYRSSPASDSASFLQKFPEAARIKPGYEPPESERPLTRADRRRAHALAMDADSTADLTRMFGEHFASIGIGDFPRRRS